MEKLATCQKSYSKQIGGNSPESRGVQPDHTAQTAYLANTLTLSVMFMSYRQIASVCICSCLLTAFFFFQPIFSEDPPLLWLWLAHQTNEGNEQ